MNDDDISDEEKKGLKRKTIQRTKTEFEHRVVDDAGKKILQTSKRVNRKVRCGHLVWPEVA